MNTKVFNSMVGFVLMCFTLVFTVPVSANGPGTVIKFIDYGLVSGIASPVRYQSSYAAGEWIGTDYNTMFGAVVEMAAVTGGTIYTLNVLDADYGMAETYWLDVSDNTAPANYGVKYILVLDNNNSTNTYPPNTMSVSFTTMLNDGVNGNQCLTSTSAQTDLVARAIFTHSPLKARSVQNYYYDPRQNKLVIAYYCLLSM